MAVPSVSFTGAPQVMVLVTGGRDFNNRDFVLRMLDAQHRLHHFTHLMHGGSRGVDKTAGAWAHSVGVQEVCCYANWTMWPASGGIRRNMAMVALRPDLVIAFPGGRGTADCTAKARAAGLKIVVVEEPTTA